MKYFLFIVLSFTAYTVCSQTHVTRVKDTSFTLQSAFAKAQKSYPFITIAEVKPGKEVKIKSGISYCQASGRNMMLDVFYPQKKNNKHAAVLLVHGGGWRSGTRDLQNNIALYLAQHGYVAITADYRLAGEAKFPAAVTDLKNAVKWIRQNAGVYNINPNKIAVLGCSAGGQLAALLGTTNDISEFDDPKYLPEISGKVNAVIDIDGILAFIHPESGEGDNAKGISAAEYWLGASKEDRPDLWNSASPLNHVNSSAAPILFINSSVARMHAGRDDMMRKLKALNIYSEVHTIQDTPHTFWFFDPWFQPAMNHTTAFLEKVFPQ